jgi:excisionase family DNA binding protein
MNTQSLQMINLSVEDLTVLISNCVKAELQKINNVIQLNPIVENDEVLSRKQASELLNVSYTTLFHWNNDKTLPAQKIGKRVYYQKSAIMEKLNHVA